MGGGIAEFAEEDDSIVSIDIISDGTDSKSFGAGAHGNGSETVPKHKPPVKMESAKGQTDEEILERMKKFEDAYVGDSIEHAMVVTKRGDVYHCFGVSASVYPDEDLGDELVGARVTHTHPAKETEYSFSDDDIKLFQKYSLELLRGADIMFRYEMNRDANAVDSLKSVFDLVEGLDEDIRA